MQCKLWAGLGLLLWLRNIYIYMYMTILGEPKNNGFKKAMPGCLHETIQSPRSAAAALLLLALDEVA